MAKMITNKKEEIISVEAKLNERSGMVTTFLTWDRLEEVFKKAGELATNEKLNKIVVSEHGIQYYIDD